MIQNLVGKRCSKTIKANQKPHPQYGKPILRVKTMKTYSKNHIHSMVTQYPDIHCSTPTSKQQWPNAIDKQNTHQKLKRKWLWRQDKTKFRNNCFSVSHSFFLFFLFARSSSCVSDCGSPILRRRTINAHTQYAIIVSAENK